MLAAFGENRLMPSPELECSLINVRSGYKRTNRSWLLARLLRDLDHWLPDHCERAEANKLQELQRANPKIKDTLRIGLRVTVWQCNEATGRGRHDVVYWSGVGVILIQLLALGLPPLILYGEYFTIMVTGCGIALALASGALGQWTEEKIGVRNIDAGKTKEVLLTEGQGAHDIVMILSGPRDLDLEALAGSYRELRNPHRTRIASSVLAILWIALLVTVAGWEQHTWFLLGVGIIGILHNVFVAGWERTPPALGIPLDFRDIFVNSKVMQVLWELEERYPRAGAAAVDTFFPGGVRSAEKAAWEFASRRYEDWNDRGSPYTQAGVPDAWDMPDSSWVLEKNLNLNIFSRTV